MVTLPPLAWRQHIDPRGTQVIGKTGLEMCPVCGKQLVSHKRCAGCTILVGPGHVEKTLTGEYCAYCFREKRRPGVLAGG